MRQRWCRMMGIEVQKHLEKFLQVLDLKGYCKI